MGNYLRRNDVHALRVYYALVLYQIDQVQNEEEKLINVIKRLPDGYFLGAFSLKGWRLGVRDEFVVARNRISCIELIGVWGNVVYLPPDPLPLSKAMKKSRFSIGMPL